MASTSCFYTLQPLTKHFGVQVLGIDLSSINWLQNPALVGQMKSDLVKHRVLLFRNQELSGEKQVDISNALGRVTSTFYKHPKSPHPDVFRVSNNESEGCRNVGRSGYHVDGTFLMTPFCYQTMYFPSVAAGGDTNFIPLKELYESVPDRVRQKWDKLWMVTSSSRTIVHPLVYQHPFRHEPTMMFHCGEPFVEGWILREETDRLHNILDGTMLPPGPVQQELTDMIESKMDEMGLRVKWSKGDFMIRDNIGLAHYATEGTQEDWKKVGLRILHRTTILSETSETIPRKTNGQTSFEVE